MPYGIGATGFALIILIALLLFGPSKLPQLGRAIGTTIREFKAGNIEREGAEDSPLKKDTDSRQ